MIDLERRRVLTSGGLTLAAVSTAPLSAQSISATPPIPFDPRTVPGRGLAKRPPLAPIKASMDRVISLEACLRPFRPQGPRIEIERMGAKAVVHNYGHGGSGWSLSWGSARRATTLARSTGERSIAVIGCGAIGLTTAVHAQRAGLKVRIYTKDQLPYVRSFRATGVWSPSARIVALPYATPEFRKLWEEMARFSYFTYSSMLGLAGNPIEWTETYKLSDTPFAAGASLYTHNPYPNEPEYPHLEDEHTPDLMSAMQELSQDQHPFPVAYARRLNSMMFNIPAYARMLMQEFLIGGGEVSIREFATPHDFQQLPERTIVNCTGYAARVLLNDDTLVPVRGQTARLIPQPEVDYAISYDSQNVYTVPRRDGMIVQEWSPGDYNNPKEQVYRDRTEESVRKVAALFANARGG